MKQKHYMDIERFKEKYADGCATNDDIVIQEKLDGYNFSIRYDNENNIVKAYSRKTELNEQNNLRGAYEWSQSLNVDLIKKVLDNNLVLFAEWLCKHTVVYPNDRYNKVYCFDVYDTLQEKYLPQSEVKNIVSQLRLTYVPVFYVGKFISWEHCNSFVGKTDLGGEYGEGVVVKNQSRLNDADTRLPYYIKIVGEKFCETKQTKHKPTDIEKLKIKQIQEELVSSVVTEARVFKLLNKMVDEGIIPYDWDEHNMSIIAKHIGKEVFYDCKKEEPEIVEQVGDTFGKIANSLSMKIVKSKLSAK